MRGTGCVGCVGWLIAAGSLAGCSEEVLHLDYPPMGNAKSALIALVSDRSVAVYAHDPQAPQAIHSSFDDRAVRVEAVLLAQPLAELELEPGRLDPEEGSPREVQSLMPISRWRANVGSEGTTPWEETDALDPLFATFTLKPQADDCSTLEETTRINLDDGYPQFAFALDEQALLVGLRNGVFRVTREGATPVSSMPFLSAVRDENDVYWLGGQEGDLWRAELRGAALETVHVATATGAGELRWLARNPRGLVAGLTYDGYVLLFEGGDVTVLDHIPPSPLSEDLSNWGGVVWLPTGELMVTQGTLKRARIYDGGEQHDEILPIDTTGLGETGWGGTVLARDEVVGRTLAGSTGQVMTRSDAEARWINLGSYSVASPWNATALLPYREGFFAGDASGRVWQWSAVSGKYCEMPPSPGSSDVFELLFQGSSLVMLSVNEDDELTSRVVWLTL